MKAALNLALRTSPSLAKGEARIAQPPGLNSFGLGNAKCFKAGLQAAIVQ